MKRNLFRIFLIAAVFLAAQDVFSIAMGLDVGYIFSGAKNKNAINISLFDIKNDLEFKNHSLGIRGILDWAYLDLNIGSRFDVGKYKVNNGAGVRGNNAGLVALKGDLDLQVQYITCESLLKLPISIGVSSRIYPMIGVGLDVPISGVVKILGTDTKKLTSSDVMSFLRVWWSAGFGMSIYVTNRFALRPQVVASISHADNPVSVFLSKHDIKINDKPGFAYKVDLRLGFTYKL